MAARLLAAAAVALIAFGSATSLDAQGRAREGGTPGRDDPRRSVAARQVPRSYEEPAFARGYAAGLQRGRDDARRKARYDPVGSPEYREGDRGYESSYGSRDAYKSNYRAGFRQGYEDGYRNRD